MRRGCRAHSSAAWRLRRKSSLEHSMSMLKPKRSKVAGIL